MPPNFAEEPSICVNIYYSGKDDAARKFAEEMVTTGVVEKIRAEKGNIRYEYFFPMDKENTVLLIDEWSDQKAIDVHHQTPMMDDIMRLREKYDLHMEVFRFISDDEIPEYDQGFIRS